MHRDQPHGEFTTPRAQLACVCLSLGEQHCPTVKQWLSAVGCSSVPGIRKNTCSVPQKRAFNLTRCVIASIPVDKSIKINLGRTQIDQKNRTSVPPILMMVEARIVYSHLQQLNSLLPTLHWSGTTHPVLTWLRVCSMTPFWISSVASGACCVAGVGRTTGTRRHR